MGELARYCGKHGNEFETFMTSEDFRVNFVSDDVMTHNEGFIVTFTNGEGKIPITKTCPCNIHRFLKLLKNEYFQ